MKSLILTHSMYQDQEVLYPFYRLQEEGTVLIAAEKVGKIKGILGTEVPSNMTTATLTNSDDDYLNVFDLLVIPGGVKAMEKLRQDRNALDFVAHWAGVNKPIASICSGAQMLISARVHLIGRRIAAYPAMAVDVENTGAVFVDEPVVVDGNIVSSPHYNHLAGWIKAAIDSLFYSWNQHEEIDRPHLGGGAGSISFTSDIPIGRGTTGTEATPSPKETLTEYSTLMRFYGVSSLKELVHAQAAHVERIQAKIAPIKNEQPGTVRIG